MSKTKIGIVIGRFQPVHEGHMQLFREASENSDHLLIMVGSADEPRSPKNPFTYFERMILISSCIELTAPEIDNGRICKLRDFPYDNTRWISEVRRQIAETFKDDVFDFNNVQITIFGFDKDASSFYLRLFPDFKYHACGMTIANEDELMSSTVIREHLFGITPRPECLNWIPSEFARTRIETLALSPEFDELRNEIQFAQEYRARWAGSPFPPIFVTTDAVVVQSGHVLLIRRKDYPGKGLWALPGGFLGQTETIIDAAIRELVEETSIKLQPEVLERCIVDERVFDRAGSFRSFESRGRIITHAFLLRLNDFKPLPKVKADSDAAEVRWVPLSDLRRSEMYSDHYHIIGSFVQIPG